MLAWFKSLFDGPKRIEDPIFGSLLDMGGYWEGGGQFDPSKERIEWFITAGDDGPDESQHSFFKSFSAKYAELQSKAHAAICAATSSDSLPHASTDQLRLVAVDIPEDVSSSPWELSFESPRATHYAVQFVGWEPSGKVDVSR